MKLFKASQLLTRLCDYKHSLRSLNVWCPAVTCCDLLCLCCAGCATVAEVRKRGDEFWKEFEFYLSDMLVGEW